MSDSRLTENFFMGPVDEVAPLLLGQILVFKDYQGIITETEAYAGLEDPASHAFRGPTPRTQVMFGKPGVSYVYFIYGMYHCLNIVAQPFGKASGVLIRGLKLISPYHRLLDGPGKLCRELGITKEHNGIDLTTDPHFYIKPNIKVENYKTTPRIGIKIGLDKQWRFVMDKP